MASARGVHQRSSWAHAAGVSCLAAAALACDSEASAPDIPDAGPPPLPQAALPLLTCLSPVQTLGECTRDGDCGSGNCVLNANLSVPDRGPITLECGAQQGLGLPRDPCEVRTDCASGLCAMAGNCLQPCTNDADCELGTFCLPVEARLAADALAPVMACVRNLAFESDVTVQSGPVAHTSSDRDLVSLDMPATQGTTMLYFKPDCGSSLEVDSIDVRAGGSVLFSYDDVLDGRTALNPVSNMGPLVPVLIPNNPQVGAEYESGVAVGVLTSEATGIVSLVAAREPAGQRILDLNLFLVGGGSDEVPGGFRPGDPGVTSFTDRLRELYAGIGIDLGTVRQIDVVGSLREQLSVLDSNVVHDDQGNAVGLDVPGLDQLFELSIGVDYGGLNLFLVSDMGDLLGISGGIPGSLGVLGTAASGVAIAVDVVGLDQAPIVALHEMSHQMGLFHTSEFDGTWIEPLSDTPVCTQTSDQNGDGLLTPAECAGHGADNLMFWSGSGQRLSDQQRAVLQRSIVLR
ncbi:MAG: hypothetical protein QM778_02250 [Myxococcales bacterium]